MRLMVPLFFFVLVSGCAPVSKTKSGNNAGIKLITLDPGHFHAALVQKTMYAGVDPVVQVYAPDGADLTWHMDRVIAYNTRAADPTRWQQVVYRGSDFLEKMIAEKKRKCSGNGGQQPQKNGVHQTIH